MPDTDTTPIPATPPAPIAIIGAGAAGLMATIAAARALHTQPSAPSPAVLTLDSADKLGAKILVAGGGRCNVTHTTLDHRLYAPAQDRPTIRKILNTFTPKHTVAFFSELGVQLKTEPTGKLFPTTDKARTVLNALLAAATDAGATLQHPYRVDSVELIPDVAPQTPPLFLIHCADQSSPPIVARRLILATGGRSLPKTGSDGHAYSIAQSLGHTINTPTFPALVPLIIDPTPSSSPTPPSRPTPPSVSDPANLTTLSGLSTIATLEVRATSNKKLHQLTASTLFTHFGLSGPGPMNISRHLTAAKLQDPGAHLCINFLPQTTMDRLDTHLLAARTTIANTLKEHPNANPLTPGETASGQGLPTRLAEAICLAAQLDPKILAHNLKREQRKALARAATEYKPPISGDRGWNHAEVTAGGIPLAEINPKAMQSRVNPNLYLCGEILDVDGPIGGYNFQWAWASGNLAGTAAAEHSLPSRTS